MAIYGFVSKITETPVDPGEGYEILPIGASVDVGDELTGDGDEWWPASTWMLGRSVSEMISADGGPLTIRRKKPAPPEPRYGHDAYGEKIEPPSSEWEIVPEGEAVPMDNCFHDGRWLFGSRYSGPAKTGGHCRAFARRKPTPRYGLTYDGKPFPVGDGYELVPEGQMIQDGDEFKWAMKGETQWHSVTFAYWGRLACSSPFGTTIYYRAFRRRKPKPTPKHFWLVWNPNGAKPPTYRHNSLESAEMEARRLATTHCDADLYVLEVKGVAKSGTTYTLAASPAVAGLVRVKGVKSSNTTYTKL